MKQTKLLPISERQSDFLSACLLFLTVLFSFGLSVSSLGLYGNQWAYVLGALPVTSGFLLERLFQHTLITIFGKTVILYHFANLVFWTLAGYLFYRIQALAGIRKDRALSGALLFLVFPAFLNPASAFELSPVLAGLCLIFASIELFLNALGKSRVITWKLISGAICAVLAIMSSPIIAVLGVSISLMFIIYWLFWQTKKAPLVYVISFSTLVISLLALFQTFNPVKPGLSLAAKSVKLWLSGFLLSWRQIIATPANGAETALYAAILGLAVIFLVYSLVKIKISNNNDASIKNLAIRDFLMLIFGISLTGLIFYLLTSLFQLNSETRSGIETTQVVAGMLAALLVTSTIELLFMEKYHIFILALIIVMSAGTRYQVTGRYSEETTKLNDFLQQLSIRSDGFMPGTRLVVEQLPFDYTTRISLQALIREQYSLAVNSEILSVIPADDVGYREFMENGSEQKMVLHVDEEAIPISKNSILAVWQPVGKCVEFVSDSVEMDKLPQGLALTAEYSNPSLILTEEKWNHTKINDIADKAANTWCAYQQFANRLAQNAQWKEVELVYKDAQERNLFSKAYLEYGALLNALIHEGKINDAVMLFQNLNRNPDIQNSLCRQWTKTISDSTINKEVIEEARKAQNTLGCD